MSKAMLTRAVFRFEEMLHGKNAAALPVALLGVASVLLVYRHVTEETYGRDTIKTFLGMILLQMLPLVFLEVKIMGCADPVGLLCKFGSPVLLLHACFLAFRVSMSAIKAYGFQYANATFLVLACVTLRSCFGFQISTRSMLQHSSALGLAVLALVTAYCQEFASELFRPEHWLHANLIERTITTGSDYIEILSFVPAVWMVYRENQDKNVVPRVTVETGETKKQVVAFFAFLLAFYCIEDVYQAWNFKSILPLATAAHIAHFLLLLDFSFFILAHIFNPEKLLDIKSLFTDTFSQMV